MNYYLWLNCAETHHMPDGMVYVHRHSLYACLGIPGSESVNDCLMAALGVVLMMTGGLSSMNALILLSAMLYSLCTMSEYTTPF